jgi:regulator of replication initiation timing
VNQARDLEERIKSFQLDCEHAQRSERALKVENTRLKLEIEQMTKKLKSHNKKREKSES